MIEFIIILGLYIFGVIIAKKLYKFGGFTEDKDVILWSWIGVFVILLSLSGRNR